MYSVQEKPLRRTKIRRAVTYRDRLRKLCTSLVLGSAASLGLACGENASLRYRRVRSKVSFAAAQDGKIWFSAFMKTRSHFERSKKKGADVSAPYKTPTICLEGELQPQADVAGNLVKQWLPILAVDRNRSARE